MFTAHAPAIAAGVGGPWIVLGGAALVNYALMSRERDARATSPQWTPPPSRPEPPTNIAP
jgi:hypothetical protein